jgi:hypothetical protein
MLKRKSTCSGPYVVTKTIPGLSATAGLHTTANGDIFTTNDLNKILHVTSDFAYSAAVIGGANNAFEGYQDGEGPTSRFSGPSGIITDRQGNVLVADSGNHCIRKICKESGWVSTKAGCGLTGKDNGNGALAGFHCPVALALLPDGCVAVSDQENHCLRVISPAGHVWTLCGGPDADYVDGVGIAAKFNRPMGLAVDRDGNLLVRYESRDCCIGFGKSGKSRQGRDCCIVFWRDSGPVNAACAGGGLGQRRDPAGDVSRRRGDDVCGQHAGLQGRGAASGAVPQAENAGHERRRRAAGGGLH